MDTALKNDQLKNLMKECLIEILEERRDLFYELVEESLEDIALARAIDEGLVDENVGRDEVMKVLERTA